MRLVKLKIRNSVFWSLPPVLLLPTEGSEVSPYLDVDLLTDVQKEVIRKSSDSGEIFILDVDDNVMNNFNSLSTLSGNYVEVDDIEDEEDLFPEIVSVTMDREEEDESIKDSIIPTEEHFSEAATLLKNSVSVVRKTILSFDISDENLMLLYACFDIENAQKQRSTVISFLEKRIKELQDESN